MLKTTVIACLITLSLLTTFWFNGQAAYADDPPTRLNQHLHKVDYVPAKMGALLLGQPLVHVKINGSTDAVFLVDTGASGSIISADLAKSLGLRLQPAVGGDDQPIHINGREKQVAMTQVQLFEVGSINVNNVPFLVLPNKNLQSVPGSIYDGVIGANMLEHSAILLDGQRHELGFCLPGALSPQQLNQIGLAHPYVLPLITSGSQWFVRAELTNHGGVAEENLLLDTGSNSTAVSGLLAKQIQLKIVNLNARHEVLTTEIAGEGRVDHLQLGDLTLLDHPVTVRPQSDTLPSEFGMDILSGYRVLIDFPAKKMYLQPNAPSVNITIKPQTPSVPVGNAGH